MPVVRFTRRLFLTLAFVGAALPAWAAQKRWRFLAPVTITADDITWFRTAKSVWVDVESGAPGIQPPSFKMMDMYDPDDAKDVPAIRRFEPVFCAFFLHATFVPGDYVLAAKPEGRERFTVTADHVRVLQVANWRSFAIDGKRPYGDFTNYPIDMARRLGLTIVRNAKGHDEISKADEARMEAMHREMLFVVQAYVEHAQLAPGAWAIPYDGWQGYILSRCAPVPTAQIEAYKREMVAVMAAKDGSSLMAGVTLFDVP